MNVLWIMADQLRFDYLSCYGATHIDTPNLDWLASQGVRFDKAYVQSPVCGPSRMIFSPGATCAATGPPGTAFRFVSENRRSAITCVKSVSPAPWWARPICAPMRKA